MVIHHLPNGMILQVVGVFLCYSSLYVDVTQHVEIGMEINRNDFNRKLVKPYDCLKRVGYHYKSRSNTICTYLYISGQISIIPKPELRGFWGSSLTKPPFRVTSADVVIICPDIYIAYTGQIRTTFANILAIAEH